MFTLRNPADADLIDGSIAEGSPVHQTFGCYTHGVTVEIAVLPPDWQERLVSLRSHSTGGGTGLCLEVHDLAVSKLVADREKDLDFVGGLFRHKLASAETVRGRLAATLVDDALRQLCLKRLKRLSA